VELIEHGLDRVSERRLFSLAFASASEVPAHFTVPCKHFVCLIAWDSRAASVNDIVRVVAPLLESGASYFVCWGPDCERVHDVIDEIVSGPNSPIDVPVDACIMTTAHESEPLEDALWFFLTCATPDAFYEALTDGAIGVSIGSGQSAGEIASALNDPRAFVQSVSDRGAA
jgi:hypothetical protein